MGEQTENAQLIEELIRRAQKAEEPGSLAQNQVLATGDEKDAALPSPTVVNTMTSAGYVWIYDSVTGEVSKTNRNMLKSQLGKKRPDGSFVFTTVKPNIVFKAGGDLKCMLHKDGPNRALYDTLGLPVCPKANLRNPYEVRRHMQKRHKTAWESLEEERKEKERQEELSVRRLMVEGMTNRQATPIPVDEPVAEVEETIPKKVVRRKKRRAKARKATIGA